MTLLKKNTKTILTLFTSLICCLLALSIKTNNVKADTQALTLTSVTHSDITSNLNDRHMYYNLHLSNNAFANENDKVYNSLRFTVYKANEITYGDNRTAYFYNELITLSDLLDGDKFTKTAEIKLDSYSKAYSESAQGTYDTLTGSGQLENIIITYGENGYIYNGETYSNNENGAVASLGVEDVDLCFSLNGISDSDAYSVVIDYFYQNENTGNVLSNSVITRASSYYAEIKNLSEQVSYMEELTAGERNTIASYLNVFNQYNYKFYFPFNLSVKNGNETYNMWHGLILTSGRNSFYDNGTSEDYIRVTGNSSGSSAKTINEILRNATWFNAVDSEGGFTVVVDKMYINDDIISKNVDISVMSNNQNMASLTYTFDYLKDYSIVSGAPVERWQSASYTIVATNYNRSCANLFKQVYEYYKENVEYFGESLFIRNLKIEVPELPGVHVQYTSGLNASEVVTYDNKFMTDADYLTVYNAYMHTGPVTEDEDEEESNFFNNFGEKINSWFGSDFENKTAGIVGVVAIALVLLLIFKRK